MNTIQIASILLATFVEIVFATDGALQVKFEHNTHSYNSELFHARRRSKYLDVTIDQQLCNYTINIIVESPPQEIQCPVLIRD
ncbi:hypothetical protein CAAN3_21S01981 [[Candida] anglica]